MALHSKATDSYFLESHVPNFAVFQSFLVRPIAGTFCDCHCYCTQNNTDDLDNGDSATITQGGGDGPSGKCCRTNFTMPLSLFISSF